jgi:hypothetical protein
MYNEKNSINLLWPHEANNKYLDRKDKNKELNAGRG